MFRLFVLLCIGVIAVDAIGPVTLKDALSVPHDVFINISSIPPQTLQRYNKKVLSVTQSLIKEVNPKHREDLAKFAYEAFKHAGLISAFLLNNTEAINFEEAAELANVHLSLMFNNVTNPNLQALGNLGLRTGKHGYEGLFLVKTFTYYMLTKRISIFPTPCEIGSKVYEYFTISGAIVQILHELVPKIRSMGLEGRLNEKLFHYSKQHDYDLIPDCKRKQESSTTQGPIITHGPITTEGLFTTQGPPLTSTSSVTPIKAELKTYGTTKSIVRRKRWGGDHNSH